MAARSCGSECGTSNCSGAVVCVACSALVKSKAEGGGGKA